MRMLPDNPSLDFLRREAKDLLAALREADPNTSLADAQKLLAEQYSFRGWPELKAEVERLRANPPTAEAGLAEELASAFGLGAVRAPMTPIAYEYPGRKWALETERGRWVLNPVFDWITDQQAETATALLERATAAGVLAPKPVRSPDGKLVKSVAGRVWRAHEWMELGPAPTEPVRAAVAGKAGEILARLHVDAVPTDKPITTWLTHRRPESDWDKLLEGARSRKMPWVDDLARISPVIAQLRSVEMQPPTQVVISHCDLTVLATRTGPGDDLVVVHWDFAGPHVPEWELAYVFMHWAMQPDIQVPAARALAEGYRSVAGSFPKLDVSSFGVAISAWLNWTFNQLYEAMAASNADARAFAEREARDVLNEPFSVTKIERLLGTLEPVMG